MRKLLLSASLTAILLSNSAMATDMFEKNYVRLDLGIAKSLKQKNSNDTFLGTKKPNSFTYGASFGTHLSDSLRTDISLNFISNLHYNSHINYPAVFGSINYNTKYSGGVMLLNGYYDFNLNNTFKPFIGAGIGFSKIKGKQTLNNIIGGAPTATYNFKNKGKLHFAYQLTAGTSVIANEILSFDLAYKFTNYGRVAFKDNLHGTSSKTTLKTHSIVFGPKFSF